MSTNIRCRHHGMRLTQNDDFSDDFSTFCHQLSCKDLGGGFLSFFPFFDDFWGWVEGNEMNSAPRNRKRKRYGDESAIDH